MISILKNILTVLSNKEKQRFVFLAVLDIIISILDIISLAVLLFIIRFYLQPELQGGIGFLPHWLNDRQSLFMISVFVILFGIKNWLGFVISKAQYRFISRVATRISGNKLVNYQQGGFEQYINTDASVNLRNIAFDPFEFSQYVLSGLQQVITQFTLILVAIIAIILFDAKLFLLLFVTLLPPVIFTFYFVKNKLFTAREHIRENNEISIRYLLDALRGFVEGNIFKRNQFFLSRFTNARKKFSTHLFESLAWQNLPGRIIEIFAVAGLFFLILVAKWSANVNGNMLITIGAFMGAAYKIIPGIVKVINTSGQIKTYAGGIPGLLIKNIEPQPDLHKNVPVEKIEFNAVHFRYRDIPVIQELSFSFEKGDFAGISGASGKGKTTILNLMLGFLTPVKGEIKINGNAVKSNEIPEYWPSVAYVKQQRFLIHDSIRRNICMEETLYDHAALDKAINVSGLQTVLQQFPEGLEKVITENGKNISGGQQQRIALARAIYKDAPVILLDEPFNELDEESTQSIIAHFRELAKQGKIIVLISHDRQSLSHCTKIISLDQ